MKNKQNIFGDWQLDIIKVKSDPTFFSGDLQLVIETEKPKKVNQQLNHQSPGESPGESPITKKKVKTLFCVNHQSPITNHQSPITNHQKSESWLKIRGSIPSWPHY